MYAEQIKPGQTYNVFKKCVSISILNFTLFPEETEFYSCFHIREDTRQFLYTDKMEFHLIELPKLPQELKDDKDDILLWAKFINSERKEDFEMLATKNIYIQSAYNTLQVIRIPQYPQAVVDCYPLKHSNLELIGRCTALPSKMIS